MHIVSYDLPDRSGDGPQPPPLPGAFAADPAPRYASLGLRLVAHIVDLYLGGVIITALILPVLMVLSDTGDEILPAALTIGFVLYMTGFEAIWRTTPGKYLFGMGLQAEPPDAPYPGPWKILIRESIGRWISSTLFGYGYWSALRLTTHQSWADRLAGTAVVRRTADKRLRVAIGVFTGLSIVSFAVILIEYHSIQSITSGLGRPPSESPEQSSLWKEIEESRGALEAARVNLHSAFSMQPRSARESQIVTSQLRARLDRYEADLNTMLDRISRYLALRKSAGADEYRLAKLLAVYQIRQQQAGLFRRKLEILSHFPAEQEAWNNVEQQLLDLDQKASFQMNQVGR